MKFNTVHNLIILKYPRKTSRSPSSKYRSFSSIGIRIGDDLQLQIAVRKRRDQTDETSMDDDSQDRSKGIKYDPINLEDFCGTSTFQKFEMFVASLLHQEKHQQ